LHKDESFKDHRRHSIFPRQIERGGSGTYVARHADVSAAWLGSRMERTMKTVQRWLLLCGLGASSACSSPADDGTESVNGALTDSESGATAPAPVGAAEKFECIVAESSCRNGWEITITNDHLGTATVAGRFDFVITFLADNKDGTQESVSTIKQTAKLEGQQWLYEDTSAAGRHCKIQFDHGSEETDIAVKTADGCGELFIPPDAPADIISTFDGNYSRASH
jgi:hypothetical protein